MSDPARVEALVQAECAATGAVVRKSRRGVGVAVGGSSVKAPKPAGTYEVSRAVQRAAPASTSARPSAPPPHADADAESLRRAAVHHWRARMMVKLSSLYSDSAWDAQEKPRKFFIKHRGFGPTHGRGDLPHHRRMFLRCALASAERASELAPSSLECATLRACILSLANAEDGADAADAALSRACAACRHAMRLHERWAGDASRETFEVSVLHSPGGSDAGHGVGSGDPSPAPAPPPAGASGSVTRRIESLRSMAAYAAHALADRRGGWDFETSWVRESGDGWIDEEAEKAANRVAAVVLDDDDDDDDGEDDEDEDEDDEDAAGGWDMWQSPSILDYSLAALRGPP